MEPIDMLIKNSPVLYKQGFAPLQLHGNYVFGVIDRYPDPTVLTVIDIAELEAMEEGEITICSTNLMGVLKYLARMADAKRGGDKEAIEEVFNDFFFSRLDELSRENNKDFSEVYSHYHPDEDGKDAV